MKSVGRVLVLIALMGVPLALGACSVVLDFTECTSDADCAAVAAPGEILVCGSDRRCSATTECVTSTDCEGKSPRTICESGVCVEPESDTSSPDADLSDTNDQDLLETAQPDTNEPDLVDVDLSDTPQPVACTTHSECETLSATYLCGVDGFCAEGLTEECHTVLFPEGGRDNIVFVGSIIPVTPPFDELALPLQRAVDLAIEDFNRAGGLPGGRKIAWVACDSAGSTTKAQAAATHLVHTVGVPAIIGPVLSTPFIDVTTNITANAGVLTISPSATSPNISGLDDSNLAWRVIPSDIYQSSAIVDRVLALGAGRIVVFAKNDAYGGGLLTEISLQLAAALGGVDNLHLETYEDPVKLGTIELFAEEVTRVVGSSITTMPDTDAVIMLGTNEAIEIYGAHLASLGAAGRFPDNDPPTYLFSHGAVPALERTLTHANNILGDLMIAFVEAVSPNVFDEANYAAFNLRYRSKFANEDALTSTGLSYDSTFVVLFAMSALERDSEVTGTGLAGAIQKLVDKDAGTPVSFGSTDFISTARNTLSSGGTVDLRGVSGELDFDLATGDVRTNYLGWIVEKVDGLYQAAVVRAYVLDPVPATSGTWVTLP